MISTSSRASRARSAGASAPDELIAVEEPVTGRLKVTEIKIRRLVNWLILSKKNLYIYSISNSMMEANYSGLPLRPNGAADHLLAYCHGAFHGRPCDRLRNTSSQVQGQSRRYTKKFRRSSRGPSRRVLTDERAGCLHRHLKKRRAQPKPGPLVSRC
jgi:hypothetical protein